MKNSQISELSTEELLKTQKSIKVITFMLLGALLVLICALIFLTIKNGFSVLSILPLALLPIVILNFNNLNNIKKELKSRNINQ